MATGTGLDVRAGGFMYMTCAVLGDTGKQLFVHLTLAGWLVSQIMVCCREYSSQFTSSAAVDNMLQDDHAQGSHAVPANPAQAVSSTLCTIALEACRAECFVVQQLMLLLGTLQRFGSIGNTPLTAEQQDIINKQLVPELASALRSSAMGLWLCETPSTAPVGSSTSQVSSAPLGQLDLRQLSIGSSTSRGQRVAGSSQQGSHAATEYTLAAHLLPGFYSGQPQLVESVVQGKLGPAGHQLMAFLLSGMHAGRQLSSPTQQDIGLEDGLFAIKALNVGYHLFLVREYAAVGALVVICEGHDPATASLQFLLGLSLACRLKGVADADDKQDLLDAAMGSLFRAAAGVAGVSGAPLRSVLQRLQQQRGGSWGPSDCVMAVNDLQASQQQGGVVSSAVQAVPAATRLAYQEAVMQLFEQEGVIEGALVFARAAVATLLTISEGGGIDNCKEREGKCLHMDVCAYHNS